jgi:flagellar hook-length control protein FliK
MPKIDVSLPPGGLKTLRPLTSAESAGGGVGSRAERAAAGGFKDLLNGARRRESAPAPDPETEAAPADAAPADGSESDAATVSPKSVKPTRTKNRPVPARGSQPIEADPEAVSDIPPEAGAEAADVPSTEPAPAAAEGEADPVTTPTADKEDAADDGDAAGETAVLEQQVPVAGVQPVTSPPTTEANAEDLVDDGDGNSPAEGEGKPKAHASPVDPDDVRAGQATPVLIDATGAAPEPSHAAKGPAPEDAAPANGQAAPVGRVTSGANPAGAATEPVPVPDGAPQPAAGTSTHHSNAVPAQVAATAQVGEAIEDVPGLGAAAPPGEGKARPVTSSNADVVDSLDRSTADASAPTPTADAPVPSHVAAQDATVAAATRALDALGAHHAARGDAPVPAAHAPDAQPLPPEVQFADDNHANIVSGVRGQLMPTGGTMQIRLDPPELGPLAVTIRLNDGVMEASFETSNDQAAKLLSHSLSALKTSLESQGINVERLHVQQAPKSEQSNQQDGGNDDRDRQQQQNRDAAQDHAARQEHQRKEMLRRMWAKLRGVEDPLDMVA